MDTLFWKNQYKNIKIDFTQREIEKIKNTKTLNLNNYISKDPLVARQKILKDIEDEQNELIIQLEQLKRIRG